MTPEEPPRPESEAPKPCSAHDHPVVTAPAPEKSTRRELMLKIGFGLNVVAGALIGIPIIGYVFSSFIKKMPLAWIPLGPIDKFPQDTTRIATYENPHPRPWDGETAVIPCWVRRFSEDGQDKFQIFAINCAHLGCPVRWFEESKLFLCPCHGGAYYQDGSYAAGPPPRGLFEYEYRVENGILYVKGGILPTLADPQV